MEIIETLRQEVAAKQQAEKQAHRALLEAGSKEDDKTIKVKDQAWCVAKLELEEAKDKLDSHSEIATELVPKMALGNYINAAIAEKALVGAEAEYEQETIQKNPDRPLRGTWLPFAVLAGRDRKIMAADAATDAPNADTGERISWVSRVFASGVARFLGVSFESVPPGTSEYIVLSQSGHSPAMRSQDTAHDSTAAGLALTTMRARACSAAYTIAQEDICSLGGKFENALRADLSAAISDQIDRQVLAGNGTAPNLDGIQNEGSVANNWAATVSDWEEMIEHCGTEALDGVFASRMKELRCVIGHTMAPLVAATLRGGNAAEETALGWLERNLDGVRITANAKAATNSGKTQEVLVYRTGGMGGPRAVLPMWHGGFQLIRDEASEAARRRVRITVNAYLNFAVLQAGAYQRNGLRNATGT